MDNSNIYLLISAIIIFIILIGIIIYYIINNDQSKNDNELEDLLKNRGGNKFPSNSNDTDNSYLDTVPKPTIICNPDYYLKNNTCEKCPFGSFTDGNGSTNINQCLCNPGYYGSNGNCTKCPVNSISEGVNNTTIDRCLCNPGYYGLNGNCSLCEDPLTSTNKIGAMNKSECVYPPSGFFINKNNMKFEICPKNYYCNTSGKYPCPNGRVTTREGSVSEGDCK